MPILPFGILPGHWGLRGKTKDIVKAEYELEGEELERELIRINSDNKAIELLKIDRKYNYISKEEYDYKYIELEHNDNSEYSLIKLNLDKKYGKIDEIEFQKTSASLKNEPWIGVISSEYKADIASDGFSFELDWNSGFVDMLRQEGYSGSTEEEIVEHWFEDKATEQYLSLLNEELDDGIDDELIPRTKIIHEKLDNTRTRHS